MFDLFNHEAAANSLELMANKLLEPNSTKAKHDQDKQSSLDLLIRMAGLSPGTTESWIERWRDKGYFQNVVEKDELLDILKGASNPSISFMNMVLKDAPPSAEMARLFAADPSVGQAATADPDVIWRTSQSQFFELCKMASRNNYRIITWREILGYIILRNSHRDSEIEYVIKVARFTQPNLERTTATDGKLYKMAAKYVDIPSFLKSVKDSIDTERLVK